MVTMAFEGNFTFDGLFSFGTFTDDHWTVAALSIFFMMGVFGGLLGALFNKLNTLLTQYRMKHIRTFGAGLKHVVCCGQLVTAVALASMFIIDDCRPESGKGSDVVIRLQCGQGSEHAAAAIWFATPERILQVRIGFRIISSPVPLDRLAVGTLQDLYHSELYNFKLPQIQVSESHSKKFF